MVNKLETRMQCHRSPLQHKVNGNMLLLSYAPTLISLAFRISILLLLFAFHQSSPPKR